MIRRNLLRPLHREVIWDALHSAWHNRIFWVLAFFAGILQTGGIYDVLFTTVKDMSVSLREASPFMLYSFGTKYGYQGLMRSLGGEDGFAGRVILVILLAAAFAIASVIAQGALVAGIGARARGRVTNLRAWLKTGVQKFWPVLGLNAGTLVFIWMARAFVFMPMVYVIREVTFWSVLGVLVGFLVFGAALVILTSIHLFGLQSLVLQNTTFWEALHKAVKMFERSWLIVLEKGLVLLLIGLLIWVTAFILALVAAAPLFLLFVAGLLFHQFAFASAGFLLLGALLFIAFLVAGTFAISFQYAAWYGVSKRLSEGSAMARLHRWSHWLMKEFHLFKHHARSS